MKRYRIALPDGETVLYLNMPDEATPEEVAAEAERRVAELRAEADAPAPVELPPPPPPPWKVAGVDPMEQEIRCVRCGGTLPRKVMRVHLDKCYADAER